MRPMRTARGRSFIALGDREVLTMDRLALLERRLDSDPRIASVSVVAHENPGHEFLRATAPAGCAVVLATDAQALTGAISEDATSDDLRAWSTAASERGLWHDWWLTPASDVARAPEFITPAELDAAEEQDPASSRFDACNRRSLNTDALSIAIDCTWLGPHQTGAQVLTTAAIEALARNPAVARIRLIGVDELPSYAQHLSSLPGVEVSDASEGGDACDVIWYPNQIDQRVDISRARSLGRRVITTYLDLIAYDIPRYHASPAAWAAYRSMQRRIALSVDGITTISADVAARLCEEVPRLDPNRVQPIPLGLDHITAVVPQPGSDIAHLHSELGARPFIVVLGNDFQHKNRDFAIEVWEAVLDEGVNCDLVLAGLHVRSSSSRDREERLLAQHANLRGRVHTVGHVTPESRQWLLASAGAVVYPSSAEGFGFVPYEAAALGTPATFASFGPLAELSGVTDVPTSWTVEAFARDVVTLLQDPEAARSRVDNLRSVVTSLTWDVFAERLVEFVIRIDGLPPSEGALTVRTSEDSAALHEILGSRSWRALNRARRFVARGS